MRIGEERLLEALNKAFPDKIIFSGDFIRKLGCSLGYVVYRSKNKEDGARRITTLPPWYAVFQHARAKGLSTPQWLDSKGFVWKEGCSEDERDVPVFVLENDVKDRVEGWEERRDGLDHSVQFRACEIEDEEDAEDPAPECEAEEDMDSREVDAPEPACSAFDLADFIFRKYPLAGAYHLTPEEDEKLYRSASKTVKKFLHSGGYIDIEWQEKVVLVLDTIHRLKGWTQGDAESSTFWRYIYTQYGFQPEHSDSATQKLYKFFRGSIKSVLMGYKRFFAPEGTQRYYTSLLSHALAPKQSVESLYEILFGFYAKDLYFQYIPEDSSYKGLVGALSARWDIGATKDDEVQLRTDTISSGLRVLFEKRPRYMATVCESIVKKTDTLFRSGNADPLDLQRNEWDILLNEWYQKKSRQERVRIQGERREKKAEDAATTPDRIQIQYAMEGEEVGFSIPKMRLPSSAQRRPVLEIYQDEKCVFTDELSVLGNDSGCTTRSRFVSLCEMEYDESKPLHFRAEIQYTGAEPYSSGEKLCRNFIVFDNLGNEKKVQQGILYLFASSNASISFFPEEEVYQCPHPGQLYRIDLGAVDSVEVDGQEIFINKETAKKFRHRTSVDKVSGVSVMKEEIKVDIFREPVEFSFTFPAEERMERYRISVDGEPQPHNAFPQSDSENERALPSINDGIPHRICIVDAVSDFVKDEVNYIVLSDFRVTFDKPFYYADEPQAEVGLSFSGYAHKKTVPIPDTSDKVLLDLPDVEWLLRLQAPVVGCTLMGESAFSLPPIIWYKDIPKGEFAGIQTPEGWEGQLLLGERAVPENRQGCFELGNHLHSMSKMPDELELCLSMKGMDGSQTKRKLTTIRWKPTFREPPIVADDKLYWQAEDNFIGDDGSTFRVEIQSAPRDVERDDLRVESIPLSEIDGWDHGEYPYRVFLKKKGIFSAGGEEEIFKGSFCIGDPLEWKYQGKALILRSATYWDHQKDTIETMTLPFGKGMVKNLQYRGMTVASGELAPAHYYSGSLYFLDRDGRPHPFNSGNSQGYERINPVEVYIINEYVLHLRTAEGEPLLIDRRYARILNKNPDTALPTKKLQYKHLKLPDYFDYTTREERKDV